MTCSPWNELQNGDQRARKDVRESTVQLVRRFFKRRARTETVYQGMPAVTSPGTKNRHIRVQHGAQLRDPQLAWKVKKIPWTALMKKCYA